jgi:hypothetical protein
MARKGRGRTSAWRDFERLVARIERTAAPGTTVRSPDRVRSLLTGKLREVDGSILTRVGTATILVTLECRKRSPKQDVTWIEQLGSKKNAIGAARTIAVSPVGFTEQAVEVARHYGIELRRLADISAADIDGWVSFIGALYHQYRRTDFRGQVNIGLGVLASDPTPVDIDDATRSALSSASPQTATIFRVNQGAQLVSLDALWLVAQGQRDYFEGLRVGGQPDVRLIRLDFPDDDVAIATTVGWRPVRRLEFELALSLVLEQVPLTDAKVVEYADPDGSVLRRVEFQTKGASRVNLRLGIQGAPQTDLLLVDVEPLTTGGSDSDSRL